ncbi:response regulator [Proteiniclasticum sp. C24MP]|uniref:response regulator n=1 Tax=Proteiniclasticum sp. C24MP TaxID=3374101 RepID=UPI0037540309
MKKRIIITDDFPLLVEDLAEFINNQPDMEVVETAYSAEEILSIYENVEYDLILLDIEMETINAGLMAAETIKSNHKNAKIIFLTAHETQQFILTAMALGATDYIVKGTSYDDIAVHIRNVFRGQPVLESKVQEIIMKEYKRLKKTESSLMDFMHTVSLLTPAERELIKLLLRGYKVAEIARERSVELVTVKTQIKNLLRKFNVSRSKEIVKVINELNLSQLFQ